MLSPTQLLRGALFGLVSMAGPAAWPASADHRPPSQQEYWAQLDRRDWDSAIQAAQKLVDAARAQAAQQPLVLAEALTLLGNAQLNKADYANAQTSFLEALALIDRHSGASSASLLEPLRGQGYALAGAGRDEEAVLYLERALLIARRSHGLFDVSQQGILRQLVASLTNLHRPDEAARHVNYLLRVGERSYGRRDPRLVPLLCAIGEWYSDTANFTPARASFRNALDIVEQKLGKDSIAAVEPLRGLARSYTQEVYNSALGLKTIRERPPLDENLHSEERTMQPRYISMDGERALERALKILDLQPDAPRAQLVGTLVQMGDWYQVKHLPDRAMTFYRRAAALHQEQPAAPTTDPEPATKGAAPRNDLLGFPVRLYYPMPQLATRNLTLPADQVDERYVQVEFTVTDEGEVTDAKVTEHSGTARQASEALQAIRAARFRPKFVDGQPVATPGMTNREVFRMRKPAENSRQGEAEQKDS
jgi:TonB family protein